MTARSSRVVLRREVIMCAAAARSEREFFAGLETAGLLVRLRHSPIQPAQVTGYAVSLPGMTHWDGQQLWYRGQTLNGQLSLGALRRRWQEGRPGTLSAPNVFTAADALDIFGYTSAVATEAARQLHGSPAPAQSADIAWAAADVLTAAAQATGSPELQEAADSFSRAARASWGRIPPPSPGGAALRTAAYLLATCTPPGSRRRIDRLALFSALAGLARGVGELRQAQHRLLQASAAHSAATALAAATATSGPAAPAGPATVDIPWSAAAFRPAAPISEPGRAGRPRPARQCPRPGPSQAGPGPAR